MGVRIGELSNVDKDALDFAFDALTRKTPLAEGLRLEVEWCPRRQKCLDCGEEFDRARIWICLPECGEQPQTTCIGGTELDIAYLELEEPCGK